MIETLRFGDMALIWFLLFVSRVAYPAQDSGVRPADGKTQAERTSGHVTSRAEMVAHL